MLFFLILIFTDLNGFEPTAKSDKEVMNVLFVSLKQ